MGKKKWIMSAKLVSIFATSLLMILSEAADNNTKLTGSDQEALHSIRESLLHYNPNSTIVQSWKKGSYSSCSWTGIKCSSDGTRVMELKLSGAALAGPLPQALGNLTGLSYLRLAHNNFSGSIPPTVRNLMKNSLKVLELPSNNLVGEISPLLFADCSELMVLNLSDNRLTGRVPEFGMCKNLARLSLSWNEFTGEIPGGFLNNCRALTELDLEYNNLSGTIPAIHVNCSSLTVLRLSKNRLRGQLPKELSMLSKLQTLSLGKNMFTGSIPPEFGRLIELRILSMEHNQLVGTIPATIGQMLKLKSLYLHINNLKGSIPPEIGSLNKIQVLDLNNNELSGTIPAELGLARSLHLLFMSSNSLTGPIPQEIGNLAKLQGLDLSGNRLTGNIPSHIRNLQSLLWLSLSRNHLEGHLPPEIVECSSLVWLNLAYNRLSGKIPGNIGLIGARADETFARNRVSPPLIPDGVGGCWAMSKWMPQKNRFIFDIFKRSRCYEFWSLVLQGFLKYPICINDPHNVRIPAYIQLTGNRFSGAIPASLGNYVRLGALFLADNMFTGNIPVEMSNLTGLWQLNLSNNNLTGTIPQGFEGLTCLTTLDLSSNNLGGLIPPSLVNLTSLTKFNVSYNEKLWGPVPTAGQFLTFPLESYLGNSCLIIPFAKGLNLNTRCSKNSTEIASEKSGEGWAVETICIAAAALVIGGTCAFWAYNFCLRGKCKEPSAPGFKFGPTKISYEQLINATTAFSEANLLGVGSFGSVYKGVLNNGTNVAVKVLDLQNENAHQSFSRECDVLRRVRHRNVIRIITTCSSDDFKAIIFPLMPNGSLEKWLYPDGEDECKLNLSERLRISMEVAQGLEYLHHHCVVQVVHCDLKPNNVLLGDDFTAYIADFGISKLVLENFSGLLDSTNALRGSIGYMAPEYGAGGKVWANGDVYSFGILLLELLTRRKPTDNIFVEGMNLPKWVRMHFQNRVTEVLDKNLQRNVNESEKSQVQTCITQILQVGLVCASESPEERPTMMEVVRRLDTARHTLLGMPRAFELPVDISYLLMSTSRTSNDQLGTDTSWSVSTA